MSSSTTFQYGLLSPLDVVSSCVFSQVSSTNPANPAYTVVTYDSTQIQPDTSANCISASGTTCQHGLSGSYSLTNWMPQVASYSQTALTLTSYTFFQGQYYSLCESSLVVPAIDQVVTPTADLTACSNTVSSASTVTLSMQVSSVVSGDLVYITGLQGVLSDSRWTPTTINATTWYIFTLTAT